MYLFMVSLILLTGALGQISRNGTCNFANILAVRDLNVTQLSGDWHQIRRIMNTKECGTCSTMRINATLTNNSLFDITISSKEVKDGKVKYRNGSIGLQYGVRSGIQGYFLIEYEDIIYNSILLATNYTDYAVLYSCKNINDVTKNVWAWVLSRNTTLSEKAENIIKSVVYGNDDLRNAPWTSSDHSKKACEPNSSTSFRLSSVLGLLVMFVAGRNCA